MNVQKQYGGRANQRGEHHREGETEQVVANGVQIQGLRQKRVAKGFPFKASAL